MDPSYLRSGYCTAHRSGLALRDSLGCAYKEGSTFSRGRVLLGREANSSLQQITILRYESEKAQDLNKLQRGIEQLTRTQTWIFAPLFSKIQVLYPRNAQRPTRHRAPEQDFVTDSLARRISVRRAVFAFFRRLSSGEHDGRKEQRHLFLLVPKQHAPRSNHSLRSPSCRVRKTLYVP